MGFRDCVSDISKYLVETEGLSLNNSFRLRLLSHLQCFTDNIKETEPNLGKNQEDHNVNFTEILDFFLMASMQNLNESNSNQQKLKKNLKSKRVKRI